METLFKVSGKGPTLWGTLIIVVSTIIYINFFIKARISSGIDKITVNILNEYFTKLDGIEKENHELYETVFKIHLRKNLKKLIGKNSEPLLNMFIPEKDLIERSKKLLPLKVNKEIKKPHPFQEALAAADKIKGQQKKKHSLANNRLLEKFIRGGFLFANSILFSVGVLTIFVSALIHNHEVLFKYIYSLINYILPFINSFMP